VVETKKTWLRELAVVLIIGLGVLAYADKTEMVELLVWPIATITIGAFVPSKLQQLQSIIPSR
jgi:hypothetical protein